MAVYVNLNVFPPITSERFCTIPHINIRLTLYLPPKSEKVHSWIDLLSHLDHKEIFTWALLLDQECERILQLFVRWKEASFKSYDFEKLNVFKLNNAFLNIIVGMTNSWWNIFGRDIFNVTSVGYIGRLNDYSIIRF